MKGKRKMEKNDAAIKLLDNVSYFAKHFSTEEVEAMRKETEQSAKTEGARELISAFWDCVLAEINIQAKADKDKSHMGGNHEQFASI